MSLNDGDRGTSSSLSARLQLFTEQIFATDKFLKFRNGQSAQTLPLPGSEEGLAAVSNNLDDGPPESSRSADLPSADLGNEVVDTEGNKETIGPTTFVQKMQAMITALPSFPSPVMSSSRPNLASSPQQEPSSPSSSNPILPATDNLANVWSFLSPRTSNRSMEPDSQSLLSALDLLQSPRGRELANGLASPTESTSTVLDCVDDNNSVMVYGPLEPDNTSEVEIACSEIVSVYEDGEEIRTPQARFIPLPAESIEQVLMGANETLEKGKANERKTVDDSSVVRWVPPDESWKSPLSRGGQLPEREYRVWVPSLTKISVQTMWWGFRIYLPPPVLDILNNKQLQAAKRAAIITGALKWLMDHIPLPLLPPQMRPAVQILRRLVPYLGYVGGLIAWSWSAVKSFDKGHGVVLTATWLLPIALIPGTWEADDFPPLNMGSPSAQTASTSTRPHYD